MYGKKGQFWQDNELIASIGYNYKFIEFSLRGGPFSDPSIKTLILANGFFSTHIVAHCANSVQPDASSSKVWSLMDS